MLTINTSDVPWDKFAIAPYKLQLSFPKIKPITNIKIHLFTFVDKTAAHFICMRLWTFHDL